MKKNKITILLSVVAIAAASFLVSTFLIKPKINDVISVDEALKFSERGHLQIVDMRSDLACDKTGKAKGSIHFPTEKREKSATYLERLKVFLEKEGIEDHIALICNTGHSSEAFLQDFLKMGIKDVSSIKGGMHLKDGWLDKKLPLDPCSDKVEEKKEPVKSEAPKPATAPKAVEVKAEAPKTETPAPQPTTMREEFSDRN